MKLCFKFIAIRSALLNMSLVPSLDTCVSELNREERHLLNQ